MMRIDPRVQRAIVQLHLEKPHLSARTIAAAADCSPGTAHSLRMIVQGVGLTLEEMDKLSDSELAVRLFGKAKVSPQDILEPDWNDVHKQLQEPDSTLIEIWRDWQEMRGGTWSYQTFAKKYSRWRDKLEVTLRQLHRAGEKTFVDFAGGTLPIHLSDGSVKEAQLFVGVLGASNYTFATLVWTQTLPDWILCNNRMVAFFGGVTQFVIPDNLKSAVTRAGLSQLVVNPTYKAWGRHHGTVIFPAKARKPRYKAKAEVGVQIAQRVILWRLRKQRWHSIEEANAELSRLLALLNARPFRKMPGCRLQRFIEIDKPHLRTLPEKQFEYFELVVKRRVPSDYHVEFEGHFYSVPYALVGGHVDLRITAGMVEILQGGQRKCSHDRSCEAGGKTTKIEHMPEAHRHAHNGEPAELRAWSTRVGPATERMVAGWLDSLGGAFYRGLLSARGLRQEADLIEPERIEGACSYAEKNQTRTLSSIRSILRFKLDLRSGQARAEISNLGEHENVRGPEYFAKKGVA